MEFNKKIIIFKNDRLGDLLHSVPAIINVIEQNPDKKIIIFLSKISKNFYFLFKKKNTELKILNYNLTIFEKIKILIYIIKNNLEKIYILSPKNFYFYLPLVFKKPKFFGICMNGLNEYKRPSSFLRKFLYKFVINDRGTQKKRKSVHSLLLELTTKHSETKKSFDFELNIPKSDNLKKYLPQDYILVHFKKKVAIKLGWGVEELDLILSHLKKYISNIVLIKDIEKDELNLIFRKKYKTLDFDNNLFHDHENDILFFDNIEGEDLYNLVKYSKKVIAFHGTIPSIALLNNTPVLDLFYCDIKNIKDYRSYKNAFYEFKPKYNGYDFIIPSKSVTKTIKKMNFAIKN
jgi:hypothetical protein